MCKLGDEVATKPIKNNNHTLYKAHFLVQNLYMGIKMDIYMYSHGYS